MTRGTRVALVLAILVAIAVAAVAFLCYAAMPQPEYVTPPDYYRRLEEAIVLDKNGQTTVRGEIVKSPSCYGNVETCHFYIVHNGVSVRIDYLVGVSGEDCKYNEPARVAETLGTGYEVEVFGKYMGSGAITLCDSEDYYILVISR